MPLEKEEKATFSLVDPNYKLTISHTIHNMSNQISIDVELVYVPL